MADATAQEGENLISRIARSGNTNKSGYAYYRISDGTATNGQDYEKGNGYYVYFSAGETQETVSVQTKRDAYAEGNETVRLNLYNSSHGFNRIDSDATGTILDGGGNGAEPTNGNGNGNSGSNNGNTTNNVDNSVSNSTNQVINITINGNGNTLGTVGSNSFAFERTGGDADDVLSGNINIAKSDIFRGGGGNEKLIGYRGGDVLLGDDGNDLLHGGIGKDVLSGGNGSDRIYGGFGQNVFTGEKDGSFDQLFSKSDKYAFNHIYNKADNQNGSKVDLIGPLDRTDRITVQGVSDGLLTYRSTSANIGGNQVNGIGIFAGGTLEAIYTGGDLTASQLDQMTFGSMFA